MTFFLSVKQGQENFLSMVDTMLRSNSDTDAYLIYAHESVDMAPECS